MTNEQLDNYLKSCGVNHQGYHRTKNARFCPECDCRLDDAMVTGQFGKPCPECHTVIAINENHKVSVVERATKHTTLHFQRAKVVIPIDRTQPILPSSKFIPKEDQGFHALHCVGCGKGIDETLQTSLVKILVEYMKFVREFIVKGIPYRREIRVPKFVTGRACKACSPSTVQTSVINHVPGTPLPDGYDHLAIGDMFLIASVEPVKDTLLQSSFEKVERSEKNLDEQLLESRWVNADGLVGTLNGEELLSKGQMRKSDEWLHGKGSAMAVDKSDVPLSEFDFKQHAPKVRRTSGKSLLHTERKRRFPRRPVLERQYVNEQGIVVRRYKGQ